MTAKLRREHELREERRAEPERRGEDTVRRKEREEGDGSEDLAEETRVEEMRAVEEATEDAIDDNTSSLCYSEATKYLSL